VNRRPLVRLVVRLDREAVRLSRLAETLAERAIALEVLTGRVRKLVRPRKGGGR